VHSNLLKADLVLAQFTLCALLLLLPLESCSMYKIASSWGCWKCVTLFNEWRTIKSRLNCPAWPNTAHTGCKLISHVTGMPMEAVERMLEIHQSRNTAAVATKFD